MEGGHSSSRWRGGEFQIMLCGCIVISRAPSFGCILPLASWHHPPFVPGLCYPLLVLGYGGPIYGGSAPIY